MAKLQVQGTVREEETGRPVSGVSVNVYPGDLDTESPMGTAVTDAEGRFTLESDDESHRERIEREPEVYVEVLGADKRTVLFEGSVPVSRLQADRLSLPVLVRGAAATGTRAVGDGGSGAEPDLDAADDDLNREAVSEIRRDLEDAIAISRRSRALQRKLDAGRKARIAPLYEKALRLIDADIEKLAPEHEKGNALLDREAVRSHAASMEIARRRLARQGVAADHTRRQLARIAARRKARLQPTAVPQSATTEATACLWQAFGEPVEIGPIGGFSDHALTAPPFALGENRLLHRIRSDGANEVRGEVFARFRYLPTETTIGCIVGYFSFSGVATVWGHTACKALPFPQPEMASVEITAIMRAFSSEERFAEAWVDQVWTGLFTHQTGAAPVSHSISGSPELQIDGIPLWGGENVTVYAGFRYSIITSELGHAISDFASDGVGWNVPMVLIASYV